MLLIQIGNSADNSSSTGSVIPIIAGSVGGAALLIISCLLCVILFLVRRSRKETARVPNKMYTEMKSDIKMNTNPSYEINMQKQTQEDQYDYVAHDQLDSKHAAIKMDTNPSYEIVRCANNEVPIQENPSYGTVQGSHDEPECNVTIQANPSYCSNLQDTKKTLEDENKEICSSQEVDHVNIVKEEKAVYDEIDDINIDPNPSYDLVPGGIELEDNPSYSYGIK